MDERRLEHLLLEAINHLPEGDILNIVQAARENEGSLYERFSKAYHEITGTDGNPDEVIRLKDN